MPPTSGISIRRGRVFGKLAIKSARPAARNEDKEGQPLAASAPPASGPESATLRRERPMPPRRTLKPVTVSGGAGGGRWLDAFVEHLRNECHLAENTVAAYRRDIDHFSSGWRAERSRTLTIRDLADYAGWLHRRSLAPATIARHVVSLKLFCRYLQLEGVLGDNAAELLGSQKLWQRVPHVLSPARGGKAARPPRARAIPGGAAIGRLLELLYATGCRASESSHLKLCDVRLDEGLHLPRQGRQAAGRAAGPAGDRGDARLSGTRAAAAGGECRAGARVAVVVAPRPATGARADLGAVQEVRRCGPRSTRI